MKSYLATKISIIGTMLVGFLVICSGFLIQPLVSSDIRLNGIAGSVSHKTNVAGLIAECGDIFTFRPLSKKDYGVVPEKYEGPVPAHTMAVPAYGFMPYEHKQLGEYKNGELSELSLNRLLWEGYHIIWVGDKVPNAGVEQIQTSLDSAPLQVKEKTLLLRWDRSKSIPMNRNIAFSSWGITQSCGIYNQAVFMNYISFVNENSLKPDGEPPILTEEEMGALIEDFVNNLQKDLNIDE